MKRLGAAVLTLVTTMSVPASAAELTRVASSFEDKDPFGLFIDIGYVRTQQREKIVREAHQEGTVSDVSELRYLSIDSRLNLDAHLGLWRDFEFHFGVPIVFQQNRYWKFAAGTDTNNSTIYNNCLQANGDLTDPSCPSTFAGRRPIFEVAGEGASSFRGGLGDMTFGLAYAFFNQRKDDTKPTWVAGIDYTAPTSDTLDPTVITSPDSRGAIGDRNHKYKLYTAFSKRIGVADPYVQLHWTIPFRGPGWYSNCDHPNPLTMGAPENCGTPEWTRAQTGIQIPHQAGVIFGTELNAVDDPLAQHKVALDLRGFATYVSDGRYYSELSDVLHKLTETQDYLQVGGQIGFVAYAAEYFHLSAHASLAYNTEHTLTAEPLGKDIDGNGTLDVTANPKELNPNFDWRTDLVSRRFRASESTVFALSVNATFSF